MGNTTLIDYWIAEKELLYFPLELEEEELITKRNEILIKPIEERWDFTDRIVSWETIFQHNNEIDKK